MLLKSLELQGFKTFPDKTKLNFNTGITAVVGPNGSGKSNISDAIRWVLGEQAPKILRCSRMEDVVFNGTTNRKRQGYSEVTLNIDNSDRALPFDGDVVSITRRYFRSGESEYLINKAQVRLKDINELFMDTGLGRDGYSVIGQGKIDSIVSSKSEDRREIFEEAAGISRYRYRKTEAERKLAHTEDNLIRLRDIVTELEDRIGPLKTQAKKAESFLEYSAEKRGLEIALWLNTLDKSSGVIKEHEDKIIVARNQCDEADAEIARISELTESMYLEKGTLASKVEELRAAVMEFESAISERKAQVSVAKNDILHNNENIGRIKIDIEQINMFAMDIKKDIEDKLKLIEDYKNDISSKQKLYEETADELNLANVNASRSSDTLQEITAKIASLSAQQADARVSRMTCASTVLELESRITGLNENKNQKSESKATLEEMLEAFKAKTEEARKKVTQLTNSEKGLSLKLNSRSSALENLKAQADKLMLDAAEKSRRAKLLEDLEQNMEGFNHSVKTVMKRAKAGELKGIKGPVSRIISVPGEYTVAVEIALGFAMQNIVTATEDDAKRAIALLKKDNAGRATFLPVNTIKGRRLEEKGLDDCYGFIGVACDLCSCDEEYNGILLSLLGRIAVFEDINSAVTAAKRFGYKFKVVTLDGQVVNAGGSLTGGSLAKNSGLLTRTAEISDIKAQAQKLMKKADEAKAAFLSAQADYSKIEAEILGTRADLSVAAQEQVRLETELKACENELNLANRDLESLESEISNCHARIASLKEEQVRAEAVISSFTEQIALEEAKAEEISGSRAGIKEKREELSQKLQEIRLEIVTLQKDVEGLSSEIESTRNMGDNQESRKAELKSQMEELFAKNTESEALIGTLNKEIEELTEKIKGCEQDIEAVSKRRDEIEKDNYSLRQREKDKLSEREQASMELARLEERKIHLQNQYDNIITKLWEEYELTRREAEEEAQEIEDIPSANKRLAELKQKIKNLGSVNVGAIEEYKEVSERYTFMSEQVEDVEKSKKEIINLIGELTKKMKESFVESFNEINKHFIHTFAELFGGGSAKLELADPEDILNSGIDISVHPPGKIVTHLESLSGGEKALVAIALYFAIMKVRPAPFCVMDEIEAALDEVNVDRFARYMRNLTDTTQFITITHRRGTMEEADVLYGVTMQEEGISKLLELRATEVAEKLKMNAN
ncbi:MAG: chromosome segregation protein SMC [Clostridia bacterium]|nr:chromosome segregation protein SMC [Clostridia bacterium]